MSDLSSAGESSSSSSSSSSAAAPSLRNQPSTRCGSILELLPILSLSSAELDRENGLAWANGERALVSTRCRFLRNRESENGASSLHNKKIYRGKGSNFDFLTTTVHRDIIGNNLTWGGVLHLGDSLYLFFPKTSPKPLRVQWWVKKDDRELDSMLSSSFDRSIGQRQQTQQQPHSCILRMLATNPTTAIARNSAMIPLEPYSKQFIPST